MDIQRYLLIAASAALAVMLLGEWTVFKAEQTESVNDTRQRIDTGMAPTGGNEAQTPAANSGPVPETPTPAVTVEDLPTLTDAVPAPSQDIAADSTLIAVKTETLELVIDLNGGDIIEVALPRFPEQIDDPNQPFMLLEQNDRRTYIAQSGLVGSDGIDHPQRAHYVSAQSEYTATPGQPLSIELAWAGNSSELAITKRFTLDPESYVVDVEYSVTNNRGSRWQAVPFAQLKRDNTPPPNADTSGLGMKPFLGAALTQPDDRFTKFDFGDIADEPFRKTLPGGWIALMQHYFVSAWIANPNQSHNYSTRQTTSGFNIVGFTSPALAVDSGNTGSAGYRLYVGPKDQYQLAELSDHLDLTVDYGWLWWIAQPLFWLLTKIQSVVGNWGVAIILLTVLVKGAFFKLSATSYRSMARMRKLQPKMVDIREQYADDKSKQSQMMMELYRKEKVNPMGGCLPILIQMPVFIALYWVLMESVELRHAPFVLWIKDLSVMDPYFVLPLMMGASMFFMQKLNPPPPDPMQAKIMQWLPVIFTFFFLWFPAGLVLYWVVNNLLSMTQQYVITRAIEREGVKA
ncbi:inner membrane protein, 60 kDa [Luminiphilus syltensis NOR5-1B]|uniref:Membrane protein insertase YidC n=1 Tax=Luminiphilus syltensis NOR5-1B TaxID=565045 RepID=B8KUE3_9GAMM|nr:membrane protein insertase YidC [Luminiphilus syltensis]EED34653.1 inner membrane protein, 60 kDa [Luminiphilus syltensis NOR5-1B]